MRYNGRFMPATRQILVPKICQYEKAIEAGDSKKANNILGQIEKAMVKIYKNPEVGGLKNNDTRGKNIEEYINKNRENVQTSDSNNFYDDQAKSL